jgi:hypothetical protein
MLMALVYQDNRSAAGRPDGSMQSQQDDHDEEEEKDLQSRSSEMEWDGEQLIRNKSNSFNASAYENVNIFGKKEIRSKSSMSLAEGKAPIAPPRNRPLRHIYRYVHENRYCAPG